jgi:hypothetical protein
MDEQRIMDPVDTATLQKLSDLSRGLLKLHKALLELERGKYERVYGQVSSGDLLHLVLNHPQFAWLRPISELIVLIDERLDAEEPVTAAAAAALLARARTLLTPAETGTDFERGYYTALQQEPAIVLAHGEVKRLLTAQ